MKGHGLLKIYKYIYTDIYISIYVGELMGNVMIALDDEYEGLLRKLAQEKYGGKKGSLTEIVQEALSKLREIDRQQELSDFAEMLKKGLKFKYKMYTKRSEIYD